MKNLNVFHSNHSRNLGYYPLEHPKLYSAQIRNLIHVHLSIEQKQNEKKPLLVSKAITGD